MVIVPGYLYKAPVMASTPRPINPPARTLPAVEASYLESTVIDASLYPALLQSILITFLLRGKESVAGEVNEAFTVPFSPPVIKQLASVTSPVLKSMDWFVPFTIVEQAGKNAIADATSTKDNLF